MLPASSVVLRPGLTTHLRSFVLCTGFLSNPAFSTKLFRGNVCWSGFFFFFFFLSPKNRVRAPVCSFNSQSLNQQLLSGHSKHDTQNELLVALYKYIIKWKCIVGVQFPNWHRHNVSLCARPIANDLPVTFALQKHTIKWQWRKSSVWQAGSVVSECHIKCLCSRVGLKLRAVGFSLRAETDRFSCSLSLNWSVLCH